MLCVETGVQLGDEQVGAECFFGLDVVIARNLISNIGVAGISVYGSGLELALVGNSITPTAGDGIVVGTGGVRISDNEILNRFDSPDLKSGLEPTTQRQFRCRLIDFHRPSSLPASGLRAGDGAFCRGPS